jgi:hypothetical protein
LTRETHRFSRIPIAQCTSGATLAELEKYIACLRSLDAPDDARPKVGVNDNYDITTMICVVERPVRHSPDAS